jgi:NADPH-dependent ferric siderophore reductase
MFDMTPTRPAHIAVVAMTDADDIDHYLQLAEDGELRWLDDPHAATAFASMREAARMALRLPATLKAYGLPRGAELAYTVH